MSDTKNKTQVPQQENPNPQKSLDNQQESEKDVSQSPAFNALTPQVQEEVKSEAASAQVDVTHDVKSMSGKLGPKKILIYVGLIFLFVVILIVAVRMLTGRRETCGTKGEIVWWGMQHDESVFNPLIEEFEKANPGINISYRKQSPQDYRDRLTSELGNCSGPEIFELHNSWPIMFRDELSVLPAEIMSKDEFAASFYPVMVSDLTMNKGIVGMPLEYDALTLFINEDILASAIKAPPITWEDLRKMVDTEEERSLTVKNEDGEILQSGVALGETANVDFWPDILALMFVQNKVDPAKPNTNAAADVFTFYSLFKRDKMWDASLPTSTEAFSRGILAMYFAPTRITNEIVKTDPQFRFRTVPLPQLPKAQPTDPSYSYASYWFHGVWERGVNKEDSWKFLKFISSAESLQKINDNIRITESVPRAYPRPIMNSIYKDDPILASIVSLANDSKSWYLADLTEDGPLGINTRLKEIFARTLATWKGGVNQRVLDTMADDVKSVLSSFTN